MAAIQKEKLQKAALGLIGTVAAVTLLGGYYRAKLSSPGEEPEQLLGRLDDRSATLDPQQGREQGQAGGRVPGQERGSTPYAGLERTRDGQGSFAAPRSSFSGRTRTHRS